MLYFRDLNDAVARRAVGTACLVQERNEAEARAEADCWGWGFDWRPGREDREAAEREIDRHSDRVIENILCRSHE